MFLIYVSWKLFVCLFFVCLVYACFCFMFLFLYMSCFVLAIVFLHNCDLNDFELVVILIYSKYVVGKVMLIYDRE